MTDRAEVQAELAEKFVVPSPIRYDGWDDPGGTHPPTCQCAEVGKAYGSGRVYPLRRKPRYTYEGCEPYVFNDAPDALWDAVRAKGWRILIETEVHIRVVKIVPNDDVGECYQQLSRFDWNGELWGQAALELAVLRALEASDER